MRVNSINPMYSSQGVKNTNKASFKGVSMTGGEVIKHAVSTGTPMASGLMGLFVSAITAAALWMKKSENDMVKDMSEEEQDRYIDDLIKKDIAFGQ